MMVFEAPKRKNDTDSRRKSLNKIIVSKERLVTIMETVAAATLERLSPNFANVNEKNMAPTVVIVPKIPRLNIP